MSFPRELEDRLKLDVFFFQKCVFGAVFLPWWLTSLVCSDFFFANWQLARFGCVVHALATCSHKCLLEKGYIMLYCFLPHLVQDNFSSDWRLHRFCICWARSKFLLSPTGLWCEPRRPKTKYIGQQLWGPSAGKGRKHHEDSIYDVWCKIYGIQFGIFGQWYATHARHHGSRKAIIDASPWSWAFCKRPTGSGYAGTPVGDIYDALILPKDRCDTMIYADGLFLSLWFSCRSPSLHASWKGIQV